MLRIGDRRLARRHAEEGGVEERDALERAPRPHVARVAGESAGSDCPRRSARRRCGCGSTPRRRRGSPRARRGRRRRGSGPPCRSRRSADGYPCGASCGLRPGRGRGRRQRRALPRRALTHPGGGARLVSQVRGERGHRRVAEQIDDGDLPRANAASSRTRARASSSLSGRRARRSCRVRRPGPRRRAAPARMRATAASTSSRGAAGAGLTARLGGGRDPSSAGRRDPPAPSGARGRRSTRRISTAAQETPKRSWSNLRRAIGRRRRTGPERDPGEDLRRHDRARRAREVAEHVRALPVEADQGAGERPAVQAGEERREPPRSPEIAWKPRARERSAHGVGAGHPDAFPLAERQRQRARGPPTSACARCSVKRDAAAYSAHREAAEEGGDRRGCDERGARASLEDRAHGAAALHRFRGRSARGQGLRAASRRRAGAARTRLRRGGSRRRARGPSAPPRGPRRRPRAAPASATSTGAWRPRPPALPPPAARERDATPSDRARRPRSRARGARRRAASARRGAAARRTARAGARPPARRCHPGRRSPGRPRPTKTGAAAEATGARSTRARPSAQRLPAAP